MQNKKFTFILIISLCYLTTSLACDPIAFRLVNIYGFTLIGSGLIYSSLYTMLDMLTYLAGRKFVYILIIAFHFFDLVFSYIIYGISFLPYPDGYHHSKEVDALFSHLPRLFWGGILGGIAAGFIEVTLYAFVQSKTNNFFKASGISTMLVILAHNIPLQYIAFKKMFPDRFYEILFTSFTLNCISLMLYSFIGFLLIKLMAFLMENKRETAAQNI